MFAHVLDALAWFSAVYIGPAMMALGLTLLVEVTVAWGMGFRAFNDLAGVAAVSIITNPLFVWILYLLGLIYEPSSPWSLVPQMVVLEILIVLAEWRLLRWALKKDARKTLLVSAAMNTASFAAGLVLLSGFAPR